MFLIPKDARSWVEVAPDSHFPIQNLPFCRFYRSNPPPNQNDEGAGVRIGEFVVDAVLLDEMGFLETAKKNALDVFSMLALGGNPLMRELRAELAGLLLESASDQQRKAVQAALVPVDDVWFVRPCDVRAFVDFYSGIHHASNVGKMFRPDQPPLLPNYRHLPVGYNGRASSVVVSGTPITRPNGQQRIGEEVVFGPTKELDFELEMGFFTWEGNEMGEPIPIDHCEEHIAGLVLVNDWSARDVQRWEYQPLGPFLAKSFATSISPYIVTLDALEPFRMEGPAQDPEPLPHLRNPKPSHYDIHLEVALQTPRMTKPQVICRSNAKHLYWSFVQQLAHQASNGTPIEPGDLYASGTISGSEENSFGSMLELCWKGTKPIVMEETGEQRVWLEDGDTLIMTAWCDGEGYKIGFGECSATIMPAP
jgi:fumarylacetoacetase